MSPSPPSTLSSDKNGTVLTDDETAERSHTVPGLVQGGLGGPEDELLESGQEEVFSRTEVETGRIEHSTGEDALPCRDPAQDQAPGAAEAD